MTTAPINRILPCSVVDGPGCRAAVFFQGCNLGCSYCHNPETQRLCIACGDCVAQCPAQALKIKDGRICWDAAKCVQCDRCIRTCTHFASPKVVMMTPEQVMDKVRESIPFIRGLTTSGGECALYPVFLSRLFSLAHQSGLSCLMDSNGAVDLTQYPELMRVCDGVMLDVKAWDLNEYRDLTGGDGRMVQKNLRWLANNHKLQEVRIVVLPGYVDALTCVEGVAGMLSPLQMQEIPLKLIRFRRFGVRGELENAPSPQMEPMEQLKKSAQTLGFQSVSIV